MEKFSLFDFIGFVLPGGSTIIVVYWALTNSCSIRTATTNLPDIILLTGFVTLAFFLGLLVSYLGEIIEKAFTKLPNSWHEILKNNVTLAKDLDEICNTLFGYHFRSENDEQIEIDCQASERFYDTIFYLLQVEGKLEKITILQAQYIFFRNSVALATICFWCSLLVGFVNIHHNINTSYIAFAITISSGFAFFISQQMSIKRRYRKMSSTLYTFYSFYVTQKHFKK